MKNIYRLLLLASITISACNDSSTSPSTPNPESPPPEPKSMTEGEMAERLWRDPGFGLAASDEILDGVYIAMDYVYDDKGANSDIAPGGDTTYPTGDLYLGNAADIVEIRLAALPYTDVLLVGVRFNTMIDAAVPVAAIGIAEGSEPDLEENWPFDSGVTAKGVRYVVTLQSQQATLTDLTTGIHEEATVIVNNDTSEERRQLENTMTAIVPLAFLNRTATPTNEDWQIHAVSGLWSNNAWSENPFDIAFFEDSFTNWQQNGQSDLIAAGDISEAVATISFSDFPNRTVPMRTGQQARIYPSPVSAVVGEGIAQWKQGIQGFEIPTLNHYRGLYLPYSVWIPHNVDESTAALPLFLFLHGASQNHLDMLNNFETGTVDVPAFTLAPLGAGELSFYKEEGEVDVLAAMRDFMEHYSVDENRVYLSGLSMGGQGTFSIGTHRPDLFAAAIPFIGTGQSTFNEDVPIDEVGNEKVPEQRWMNSTGRELLENARNLPWRMQNSLLDPVVNLSWPAQDVQRMVELGNDYQWAVFHEETHNVNGSYQNALYHQVLDGCASGAASGCATDRDTGGIVRDINPARVIYKIIPFHFTERLNLYYQGAYWVSGMEVRDTPNDGSFGMVDVTSYALADKLKNVDEALGPEPLLVFEPTMGTYQFEGNRLKIGDNAVEAKMIAALTNLSAVSFNMARAGLADNGERELLFSSDGETSVTLTHLSSGTLLVIDGETIGIVGSEGRVSFSIPETGEDQPIRAYLR